MGGGRSKEEAGSGWWWWWGVNRSISKRCGLGGGGGSEKVPEANGPSGSDPLTNDLLSPMTRSHKQNTTGMADTRGNQLKTLVTLVRIY